MQVLLTAPKYDKGTHYLHAWSQPLINEAKKRGLDIICLEKEHVTKKKFQSYLKKQPTNIVIINAHGNEVCVTGKDNKEIILSIGDGDLLLKGKVIYIRACSSGAALGPELIKNGAKGFIGYIQPFFIPLEKDSTRKPLQDPYAGPVLECSNQVVISLLKGHSVTEAQEESMKKYEEKFDELSSSKVAMTFVLPFLLWNMDFQVVREP
jgi:hypothetical protein